MPPRQKHRTGSAEIPLILGGPGLERDGAVGTGRRGPCRDAAPRWADLSPPAPPPLAVSGARRKMATSRTGLPSPLGLGAAAAAVSPRQPGLSSGRGLLARLSLPGSYLGGRANWGRVKAPGGRAGTGARRGPTSGSGRAAAGLRGRGGGEGGAGPRSGRGGGREGGRSPQSPSHIPRRGGEKKGPVPAEGYSPSYIARRRRLTAPALLRAAPGRRQPPPPLVVAQFVQPPPGPPPRHGRWLDRLWPTVPGLGRWRLAPRRLAMELGSGGSVELGFPEWGGGAGAWRGDWGYEAQQGGGQRDAAALPACVPAG